MSAASEALSCVPVSELTSVWRLPSIRYARLGFPDWLTMRVLALHATDAHDGHSTVRGVPGQRSCRTGGGTDCRELEAAPVGRLDRAVKLYITICYGYGEPLE